MFANLDGGPSVNSDNPQERIEARRNRIKKRLEKKTDTKAKVPKDAIDTPDSSQGGLVLATKEKKNYKLEIQRNKNQLQESMKILDKLLRDGTDLLTNVEVAIDSREMEWRAEEDKARQERLEKLELEAKVGIERFRCIEKKWVEVASHKIPQDLYKSLMEQKADCDAVIEEKNKLIKHLHEELEHKEKAYYENMKKQVDDINLLVERMNDQKQVMRSAYKRELNTIEIDLMEERKEMLDLHLQKWNDILNKMGEREDEFLYFRTKMTEECEKQLDKLWLMELEEFNIVKNRLETDILQLELQFRNLKAQVLLNQERLDYNYHVLQKRDEESTIMKSNQKRKLTKMHDVMANLKKKLSNLEKQFQEEKQNLMDNYHKIIGQLLNLEEKYSKFQAKDIKKFNEIWNFNESRAKKLLMRLVELDRMIHEQYLCIQWKPTPNLFQLKLPLNFLIPDESSSHFRNVERISTSGLHRRQVSLAKSEIDALPQIGVDSTVTIGRTDHSGGIPHHKAFSITSYGTIPFDDPSSRQKLTPVGFPKPLLQKLLLLVSDGSGFLIEERVKRLLMTLKPDSRNLVSVSNVFHALGITNEQEMMVLAKYFIRYTYKSREGISFANISAISDDDEEVQINHGLRQTSSKEVLMSSSFEESTFFPSKFQFELIHPNNAVRALREFITDQRKVKVTQTKIPMLHCQRLQRNRDEDTRYWKSYLEAFPVTHLKLWNALYNGFEKYNKILMERNDLLQDTKMLRQQNSELKFLLDQYLKSKVNKELKFPPLVNWKGQAINQRTAN